MLTLMVTHTCTSIPGAQGVVLSADGRARLAALIAARGERVVAVAVRVGRPALGRVLAGLPVRLGTIALVEQGIAKLEADGDCVANAERLARDTGGDR